MINIVITAGGTSEPIDNVRKITNSSTGKLGAMIADKLIQKDNIGKIFYITTKKAKKPSLGVITTSMLKGKIEIIEIETAMELKEAVEKVLKENKINYFIHAMAVSDYYVEYVSTVEMLDKNNKNLKEALLNPKETIDKRQKISSNKDNLVIMLKQTPKIISLVKEISPDTHLLGFKLLEDVSEKELINVAKKLKEKNKCDYVIANDLKKIREGRHEAFIIGETIEKVIGKEEISNKIIKNIDL